MNFIQFKNERGTTKLNLHLNKSVNNYAEISDELSKIIQYICIKNNYNWIVSKEPYMLALTLDEKVFNLDYISMVTSILK